jgi:hypothetical protein
MPRSSFIGRLFDKASLLALFRSIVAVLPAVALVFFVSRCSRTDNQVEARNQGPLLVQSGADAKPDERPS